MLKALPKLQVELKGVITGSVEVAASADFRIKGKVARLKRRQVDILGPEIFGPFWRVASIATSQGSDQSFRQGRRGL